MRFGRYEIVARLAAGGMGEVFRARLVGEAGFEKAVALKRVFAHLSEDPKYRDLFIREAKVTARLVHPNIIQIYELGTENGQLFIAMEFVDGTDFASLMNHVHAIGGAPDLGVLAIVARDVLEGLAFAHGFTDENGTPRPIVHRDMSPQNILLSAAGVAKICDFGIARGALTDTSRTDILKGQSAGKRSFMPPEQAHGGVVDQRADLFALGVTLWMAASGHPFYPPDIEQRLLAGTPLDQPRLRDVWPEAPPDFAAIIDKAVQLDRDHRFQNAASFLQAIDEFLVPRGAAQAREALRELVHDVRHTVIQRGAPGARPTVSLSRATHVEGASQSGTALLPSRERSTGGDTETVRATLPRPLFPAPPPSARWWPAALGGAALLGVAVVWVAASRGPELPPPPMLPREITGDRPFVETPTRPPPLPFSVEEREAPRARPPEPERPARAEAPSPRHAAPTPAAPPPAVGTSAPASDTPSKPPRAAKSDKRLGYLTLEVRPASRVRIDGRAVEGTTPLTRLPLAVGRRWVTIEAPNGKTAMIMVDIREGEVMTRSVTLE